MLLTLWSTYNFYLPADPLPLMSLCRSVIRQNLTKEGIEKGLVEELNLPGTIKDFLTYNRRKTTNPEVLKEADQMTD